MKKTKTLHTLSLVLTAGLTLSCVYSPYSTTVDASVDSDNQELSVLSRVVDSNNNGLIKYSYKDENGNTYELDTSSDSKNAYKRAANLPSSYNLNDYSLSTSIKDQGVTGACWAFGAIKAMESNAIKDGLVTIDNADFSENHLAWYTYHGTTNTSNTVYGDRITYSGGGNAFSVYHPFGNQISEEHDTFAYDLGGNALNAIATLAQWSGASYETTAPFTADTYSQEYTMADSMTAAGETLRYNAAIHLQNADCLDNATNAEIKQAIMEYGALDIAMYYDPSGFDNFNANGTSYYQKKYSGQMAKRQANHCVTIVGWDDNYSRSNFAYKPSSNGAWLIANSYSEQYNDNGYFWLSYEEPSICEIYTMDAEPADNYDNNYQYDGLGPNDSLYIKNSKIYGANVFTADASSAQSLKAVSFYTITDDQPYTIKIYKNVTGNSPTSGTIVSQCTTSGTAKYNGYHTIKLNNSCTLSAGEKFSVVITYKYKASTKNQAYLPVEGETFSYGGIKYNYSAKSGQSYYYLNNEWYDAYTSGYNNICIKAFTDNIEQGSEPDDTTIYDNNTPAKTKLPAVTLGENEKYTISHSFVSDTAGTVFISSDENIAYVDSNGVITANQIGTTNINLSTDDGNTASLKVTVKQSPDGIKASPAAKTLKKGKTFKIKVTLPEGTASKKITYSSSNKKIAKVDSNGKVSALKKGRTTITVKTYNNKKAVIRVKVTNG